MKCRSFSSTVSSTRLPYRCFVFCPSWSQARYQSSGTTIDRATAWRCEQCGELNSSVDGSCGDCALCGAPVNKINKIVSSVNQCLPALTDRATQETLQKEINSRENNKSTKICAKIDPDAISTRLADDSILLHQTNEIVSAKNIDIRLAVNTAHRIARPPDEKRIPLRSAEEDYICSIRKDTPGKLCWVEDPHLSRHILVRTEGNINPETRLGVHLLRMIPIAVYNAEMSKKRDEQKASASEDPDRPLFPGGHTTKAPHGLAYCFDDEGRTSPFGTVILRDQNGEEFAWAKNVKRFVSLKAPESTSQKTPTTYLCTLRGTLKWMARPGRRVLVLIKLNNEICNMAPVAVGFSGLTAKCPKGLEYWEVDQGQKSPFETVILRDVQGKQFAFNRINRRYMPLTLSALQTDGSGYVSNQPGAVRWTTLDEGPIVRLVRDIGNGQIINVCPVTVGRGRTCDFDEGADYHFRKSDEGRRSPFGTVIVRDRDGREFAYDSALQNFVCIDKEKVAVSPCDKLWTKTGQLVWVLNRGYSHFILMREVNKPRLQEFLVVPKHLPRTAVEGSVQEDCPEKESVECVIAPEGYVFHKSDLGVRSPWGTVVLRARGSGIAFGWCPSERKFKAVTEEDTKVNDNGCVKALKYQSSRPGVIRWSEQNILIRDTGDKIYNVVPRGLNQTQCMDLLEGLSFCQEDEKAVSPWGTVIVRGVNHTPFAWYSDMKMFYPIEEGFKPKSSDQVDNGTSVRRSWPCLHCKRHNFLGNAACNKCGTVRSLSSPTVEWRNDVCWICVKCTHENYRSRRKCQRCHTKLPGVTARFSQDAGKSLSPSTTEQEGTYRLGDWICHACSERNTRNNVSCGKCGERTSQEHEVLNPAGKALVMWKCSFCSGINHERAIICSKCSQPKEESSEMVLPNTKASIDNNDVKLGDWFCQGCGRHCDRKEVTCRLCVTHRPSDDSTLVVATSTWTCPRCDRSGIYPAERICPNCKALRPQRMVGPNVFPGWLCWDCNFVNWWKRAKCAVCEKNREDVEKKCKESVMELL